MPHAHDNGSLVSQNKDKTKQNSPDQLDDPLVFEGIIRPDKDEDGKPSVGFDYRRYEHLLSDTDISPEDKRRVIEAIWDIVTSFIRLGFGVHPLQLPVGQDDAPCGQLFTEPSSESADLVKSKTKDEE